MNWNTWIRQIHRWLSIAFTAGRHHQHHRHGRRRMPIGSAYLALLPLFLLLFSGLYLFVLPYAAVARQPALRR